MDYIFNELSIQPVYSKEDFNAIMKSFVEANVEARLAGLNNLRLYDKAVQNLYELRFSTECSVFGWLDDNKVDRDLQDNFRLITTTIPLIRAEDLDETENFEWAEYFVETENGQHRAFGIGAAHIYQTLSASFLTTDFWKATAINVTYKYINKNAEEYINTSSVKHFSTKENFSVHLDGLRNMQRDLITKSEYLWDKREEMFPNLIFLDDLKGYFFKIGDSHELTLIKNTLHLLNDYTSQWANGGFNYREAAEKTHLKISPESSATLQKFGSQRKFTIPVLGKKMFDLHVKLGETRIHFYPHEDSRKIYIGYAGKHLRIVSTN